MRCPCVLKVWVNLNCTDDPISALYCSALSIYRCTIQSGRSNLIFHYAHLSDHCTYQSKGQPPMSSNVLEIFDINCMQFPSNMIFNDLISIQMQLVDCFIFDLNAMFKYTIHILLSYFIFFFIRLSLFRFHLLISKLLLLAAQWKRVKLSSVKRAIEVSLWSFTKVNGFPRHGGGQWNAKFFPSHLQQKMWKTNFVGSFKH